MSYSNAPKKRRWLGPVIVLGVLAILVVAAFFVAEKLVRDAAADVITSPLKQALGTEGDLDVDFGGGSLIFQALSGSVDEVAVTADDVTLAGATGDVELTARGVPLDPQGKVDALDATVFLDGAGVQALAPVLAGEGSTLELVGEQLVVSSTATLLGQSVPVMVVATPAAADGSVTFTVVSMTVNGDEVSVDEVRAGKYGPGAAALVSPPSMCVAQFLPAALSLTDASIANEHLVLRFAGTGVALAGGGLSAKGSCPEAGS